MDRKDRLTASQSDEGRYRLLVDAITDYAIYMLDRDGMVALAPWFAAYAFNPFYSARLICGVRKTERLIEGLCRTQDGAPRGAFVVVRKFSLLKQ